MEKTIARGADLGRAVKESPSNLVDYFRFLTVRQVCKLTGMSKSSIYSILDFPKPIKLHGINSTARSGSRWVESEVIEWMQSRIQIRDAKQLLASK